MPYYKLSLWNALLIIAPATTNVFENILILLFIFKNTELSETGIYLENWNEYLFDFDIATLLTSNDYDIKGGGCPVVALDEEEFAEVESIFS